MEASEIWNKAMQALPSELSSSFGKPMIRPTDDNERGIIQIRFKDRAMQYKLLNFTQLGHEMIGFIRQASIAYKMHSQQECFVTAPVIYPKIAKELIEMGINFIDTIGNVHITGQDLYIMRTGISSRTAMPRNFKGRIFSDAGIKLLFGMLQSDSFLDLTYREAAQATMVSASTITIVIKEMIESGWIHESAGKKILNRKKELLQRWTTAYYEKLRPKLLIGTYITKTMDIRNEFKGLNPRDWDGLWSGEAAGNIYTGYLSPMTIGMFVPAGTKDWMRKLKLLPIQGSPELEVFSMFWNQDHPIFDRIEKLPNAVHPILAYAELMGTGDSRNIETAQRIYDDYIQFTD